MAIIAEEPIVVSQLDRMGLPLSALKKAVAAGSGGYNATTRFHPSSGPGTFLYQEATAALRRALIGTGDWDFDEPDGQPRTWSSDHGVSIVVQTGDENTGADTGRDPSPRNVKGMATLRKVATNNVQLELFPLKTAGTRGGPGELLTWILLIAVVGDKVRAELSLPRRWSAGRPCGWVDRILLPEQDLGGSRRIDLSTPDEGGPVHDISVEWK